MASWILKNFSQGRRVDTVENGKYRNGKATEMVEKVEAEAVDTVEEVVEAGVEEEVAEVVVEDGDY